MWTCNYCIEWRHKPPLLLTHFDDSRFLASSASVSGKFQALSTSNGSKISGVEEIGNRTMACDSSVAQLEGMLEASKVRTPSLRTVHLGRFGNDPAKVVFEALSWVISRRADDRLLGSALPVSPMNSAPQQPVPIAITLDVQDST